jgi:hypothetical protein
MGFTLFHYASCLHVYGGENLITPNGTIFVGAVNVTP